MASTRLRLTNLVWQLDFRWFLWYSSLIGTRTVLENVQWRINQQGDIFAHHAWTKTKNLSSEICGHFHSRSMCWRPCCSHCKRSTFLFHLPKHMLPFRSKSTHYPNANDFIAHLKNPFMLWILPARLGKHVWNFSLTLGAVSNIANVWEFEGLFEWLLRVWKTGKLSRNARPFCSLLMCGFSHPIVECTRKSCRFSCAFAFRQQLHCNGG